MTHDSSDSPVMQIPLKDNLFLVVDDVDSDIFDLNCRPVYIPDAYTYYAYFNMKSTQYAVHRLIMERILERPLIRSELVDHVNKNGLDNRRSNLRLATRAQNGMNRKVNSNSKSGYKGVYEFKGYWRAMINIEGKRKSLGYFTTPELAADAYNQAATRHFGEFANLNVIREGDPSKTRQPKKMGRPRKK